MYYVIRKSQATPVIGFLAMNPATSEFGPAVAFPQGVAPSQVGLDVNGAGTQLAFLVSSNTPSASIFVMGVDGSGWRQVGGIVPASRAGSDLIRWTPDGSSILYVTTETSGRSRVMRIAASGGTAVFEGIETAGPIYNIDPSPDGSRIAYSVDSPATTEVWAVDNIMAAVAGR
jgi:Tol biopolymer transport system component